MVLKLGSAILFKYVGNRIFRGGGGGVMMLIFESSHSILLEFKTISMNMIGENQCTLINILGPKVLASKIRIKTIHTEIEIILINAIIMIIIFSTKSISQWFKNVHQSYVNTNILIINNYLKDDFINYWNLKMLLGLVYNLRTWSARILT